MSLVLSLDKIRERHRSLVGGKCFALANMAQQGMRVPQALCVTTEAYGQYVSQMGLRERILMELGRKSFKEMRWEELWDTSLRLRNMFLNTPLPDQLRMALESPIEQAFGVKAVVVRSSAPGEDSTRTSFAGLHESYVNIEGSEAILDHIRLVWASLWSDRALLYRQELDLQVEKSAMAVAVQEIVVGDRSGVVFGRNPNDPGQAVIEAVYGLNQGLVDGTVEPDRWVLDRDTGKLFSHMPAGREKAIFAVPGGLQLKPIPSDRIDRAPLDPREVSTVFNLCRETEKLFGTPQDVEWTFREDLAFVLQSRPVTQSLSQAGDDERPWYFSLQKSFETLKKLRKKIEELRLPQMAEEAHGLAEEDLRALSDAQLAEEIERRMKIYSKWNDVYREEFIPMAHGIRLFGQVYNNTVRPSDPYEFMTLLGATGMVSVKRNRMLQEMATMIRTNADLAGRLRSGEHGRNERFEKKLDDFIEEFGDLSCGTDQCVQGRYPITKILLQMASQDSERQPVRAHDSDMLKEQFLSRFKESQTLYAEELLELGRASYRLRDDDNIYLGKIRSQMTRAVNEGIERIQGQMTAPAHDFDTKDIVSALKYEDFIPQKQPPKVPGKGEGKSRARQMVGQPAGPGIGKGRARVVSESPDLMDFQAGEILVCDALDPTMTFVVPLCEGIVERRGGMLIHGAIIAREYGLPCVTGVPEAVSLITTGDRLTVDGYLGIVTIHREG